jgi:hypothetical protein
MEEEDRLALYAGMYGNDDEDEGEIAPIVPRENRKGKSVSVLVDGHPVEVVTRSYVDYLETVIEKQKLEIQKLGRMLRIVERNVRQQRAATNMHVGHLNDIRHDLENKIDRRD